MDRFLDKRRYFGILLLSSAEHFETSKVRESFLGLSFFLKNVIIHPVEFEGPPHGEGSALDTRIEGFNPPWLHTKNRLNWWFLVCEKIRCLL